MKPFTKTNHCKKQVHCRSCRNDIEFRRAMMVRYDWDGKCPHGYTADNYPEPKQFPSVHEQVINLAQAVAKAAKALTKGEQVLADIPTREGRIEMCQSCDYLNGTRCAKCGCFTTKKISLQTENCPIGKW